MLSDATLILKVKEPYATALVEGLKDCENRSWTLETRQRKTPTWVVIASSQRGCDQEHAARVQDCQARLDECESSRTADQLALNYGHILGLVRVDRCVNPFQPDGSQTPKQSAWHNPGSWAWMIGDAIKLRTPIPLILPDCSIDPFQTKVTLGKRVPYWAMITDRGDERLFYNCE